MNPLANAGTATVERPEDDAAALYELYRQRIRQYCYGQLRDRQEAEDALQTTFLYAFTLLQRGTKPKRPLPWLYTIAHNVCRTRRRALRRRTRIESGVDLETLHESVGRNDPPHEDVAQLASLLTTLPSAQREALLLREWQGLSYNEIAERLGLTESAVEAVLFRARRSLARTLRPAAERVASAMNGVLLLPLLRRLAPFGNGTKLTTAALVAGTAAATTLLPLADTPARAVPHRGVTPHVTRRHVTATATPDAARRHAVVRRILDVPAAPAPQPAALPAPQPTPAPPAAPPQQTAEPAVSTPTTSSTPTAAAAAAPPVPSAATPPAPAAPAPPPVQTVVATAESATDAAASTAADAVSTATSTVDAVTSGVESTVDSTVSSVTNAVPKLPLPTSTPLQRHP